MLTMVKELDRFTLEVFSALVVRQGLLTVLEVILLAVPTKMMLDLLAIQVIIYISYDPA